MSHQTKRLLKRFWRAPGNPRLKGLFLAAADGSGHTAKEVGEAWIDNPKERKRHLQHVEINDETRTGRILTVPATETYSPGAYGNIETTRENAVARTLARKEFSGGSADSLGEDGKRFLSGQKGMDTDKYIKRALLNNSVAELDVLFRKELETAVIQGAAPRKIARDAANVINVTKQSGDLPRGSDQAYAEKGSQGAPIRTGDKNFDTVSFTTERYGAGFEISDELIRQSEPDVLELLVRDAGAQVENAINRTFINNLVDNANQEHDTAGSNQDVTMVNKAIEQVELQDFITDTAVMHPEFKTDLFEDSNLAYANRAGSDDTIRQREFNPLFGLEMFTMSDGAHNTSNQTWGFEADGEIGAVAYQRDHAALVLWEDFDMEMEEYDDPIRRLSGGNVVSYADSVYRQADAAARIEY